MTAMDSSVSDRCQTLILAGGGHAHVAVLADWIRNGVPAIAAIFVTPSRHLRYSGMVPGWISGRYHRDLGTVDVAALAQRAGARLILSRVCAIDPEARQLTLEDGERLGFDIVSLDTGGIGRAADILGADPRLRDVRPIDRFVDEIAALDNAPTRVAVIGGGAGGVELAFGFRNFRNGTSKPEVVLVAGESGLLFEFPTAVRQRVARALDRQNVSLIEADAQMQGSALSAGSGNLEPCDLIVAALGSGAPAWPREGGLACDKAGFIEVDRYQRSVSHPHVLAVGDVAMRQDRFIAHSGVHAVFAGPVLARNLRAIIAGEVPDAVYRPRFNSLYLMSTGDGRAVASYGPLAAEGRWVMWLKDRIDRRWIGKYRKLARGAKHRSKGLRPAFERHRD